MHIAIYVRVSTERQDTRSQEPDIHNWLKAFHPNDEVVWYTDKFSGKTMDRPGWNTLYDNMTMGLVSKVVVWRLDRLGRTAAGLTALFEEFQHRGIGFESIRDRIDLSTPAGRLLANMLASVAAYENEVRAERIRAGQAAARARGVTWGGSRKGARVKVTPEQIELIERMVAEDRPKAQIARATGLSRQTIYTIIKEEHLSSA